MRWTALLPRLLVLCVLLGCDRETDRPRPPGAVGQEPAEPPVVIIGGGPAGLSAAMELPGAVLLEASSQLGGRASWSGAEMLLVDTMEQRRAGVRDSPARAAADWAALTGGTATSDTRAFLEASSRVRDRLAALGLRFALGVPFATTSSWRIHSVIGGGPALIAALQRGLDEAVEIRLSTPVTGLEIRDHRLLGVQTRWRILPAASAVIATGGFVSRADLIGRVSGLDSSRWTVTDARGATGMALDWADRYRLGTRALDAIGYHLSLLAPPGELARLINPRERKRLSWIWVDSSGRRFTDETQVVSLGLWGAVHSRGRVWALTTRELARRARGGMFAELRGWFRGDHLAECASNWRSLAEAIGVDAGGLEQTLRQVARAARNGEVLDPPRDPTTLPSLDIGTPCAFQPVWEPAKNFGGLEVTAEGQVLAADGRPIQGLYAVGEAAGMGAPGLGGAWGFDGSLSAVIWSGWRTGAAIAAQRRQDR